MSNISANGNLNVAKKVVSNLPKLSTNSLAILNNNAKNTSNSLKLSFNSPEVNCNNGENISQILQNAESFKSTKSDVAVNNDILKTLLEKNPTKLRTNSRLPIILNTTKNKNKSKKLLSEQYENRVNHGEFNNSDSTVSVLNTQIPKQLQLIKVEDQTLITVPQNFFNLTMKSNEEKINEKKQESYILALDANNLSGNLQKDFKVFSETSLPKLIPFKKDIKVSSTSSNQPNEDSLNLIESFEKNSELLLCRNNQDENQSNKLLEEENMETSWLDAYKRKIGNDNCNFSASLPTTTKKVKKDNLTTSLVNISPTENLKSTDLKHTDKLKETVESLIRLTSTKEGIINQTVSTNSNQPIIIVHNSASSDLIELQKKYEIIKKRYVAMRTNSENRINQLKRELHYVKLQCSKQDILSPMQKLGLVSDILSGVITENQIKILFNDAKEINWTVEQIAAALTIYHYSTKCYSYLKETLHYTLPSTDMLKSFISDENDNKTK